MDPHKMVIKILEKSNISFLASELNVTRRTIYNRLERRDWKIWEIEKIKKMYEILSS